MDLDQLQDNLFDVRRNNDSHVGSIRDRYAFHEEIGRGSYGIVYRGVKRDTQQVFAIKQIDKKKVGAKGLSEIYSEVETLMMLTHPNIIRLEETVDDTFHLYLVLEYVAGGELQSALNRNGPFPESAVKKMTLSLLMALEYIHRKGIVHRDLKPANCLLIDEEDVALKIADFGFSAMIGQDTCLQRYCGTAAFMAPEIALDMNYGKPVDMWAVGVLAFVLLSGTYPFPGDTLDEIFTKISNVDFNFIGAKWESVSDGAKDFISKCLVSDSTKRMTASQALRHTWVITSMTGLDQSSTQMFDDCTDEEDGHKIPLNCFPRLSLRNVVIQFRKCVHTVLACQRLMFLRRYRALEVSGIKKPCFAFDYGYLSSGRFEPSSKELRVSGDHEVHKGYLTKLVYISLEMAEASRTLLVLDLSDCSINSLSVTQQIVKVVQEHHSLHTLILDRNPLPQLSGRALLRVARNSSVLRILSLQDVTTIGNDVVQQINAALKEKKRMLHISRNPDDPSEAGVDRHGKLPSQVSKYVKPVNHVTLNRSLNRVSSIKR